VTVTEPEAADVERLVYSAACTSAITDDIRHLPLCR